MNKRSEEERFAAGGSEPTAWLAGSTLMANAPVADAHTPPWVEHDTIASSGTDARPRTPKKQGAVGALLSGGILSRAEVRRTYPYMLFVVALMFYYIAYAFAGQRIYRTHARLTEEVKELRAKSMSIASEKMQATRQSHIIVELERRGIPLRETLTPNKVIPKDDGEAARNDR